MPAISIITPSHKPEYWAGFYECLREQTFTDWEWVLVPNGPAKGARVNSADERVRVYPLEIDVDRVGALKYYACKKALGEIVLEWDHDDLLAPTALQKCYEAFRDNPKVCFVYSNTVEVNENWSPYKYNEAYGWKYRPFEYKGHMVEEAISAEPYPQNISRIWYAPNHFRAWRAKDYWAIGGHDQSMKIVDDHDLVCRFYLHGKMYHINEPLYIYKVHGDNTWLQNCGDIQTKMLENHDKYITPMMEKWCGENDLLKIRFSNDSSEKHGYININVLKTDHYVDLNEKWPFEDNTVGLLITDDTLSSLNDLVHVMNEAHRVLAHGGVMMIMEPSTDGRGAFQDPSHKIFFNSNSFWYYTKKEYQKYLKGRCTARFMNMRTVNVQPDQFCKDNDIWYVKSHLLSVKQDEPRYFGALDI